MRLGKQTSPNSSVSVTVTRSPRLSFDMRLLLCSITWGWIFPKVDCRMWNALQAQFVLCKEDKLPVLSESEDSIEHV